MRQKELRIALVCYGGVSLAVYMHGVTKEIWQLARASRGFHCGGADCGGVESVYRRLFHHIEDRAGLKLRVLPDILTGASAGGINAVFLAEAVHSGHSLEPLTDLWLENADVDRLLDPDARPLWRFAKLWAQPIAWWLIRRPGNVVSESVAPETRSEVRRKVSRFIRGRWFQPPFSGDGFSTLLFDALAAMRASEPEQPLLPPGHPIDLFVTATDYRGHREMLRLHSPPIVEESEHRLPIEFRSETPRQSGISLSNPLELTLAARATASFPGAFPALELAEIDRLSHRRDHGWSGRDAFLRRVMPVHHRAKITDNVALIDGSVLVNAPFRGAIEALGRRPSQREVDRRFVYIDPRPDRFGEEYASSNAPVGFFSAIFGSLSTIPREQPIRDNLQALEEQSRDAERLRRMVQGMRPEIDGAVEKLFGRTFFLDSPTPKRLKAWRAKAQQAAAERAGYAFQSYAQAKFSGIIERLADLTLQSAPELPLPDAEPIAEVLRAELAVRGLTSLSDPKGGANETAIAFFRAHDLGFRIRRLRLLARRLSRDWEIDPEISDTALDVAREAVYDILQLYRRRDGLEPLGTQFSSLAERVLTEPGSVLDHFSNIRLLPETDDEAEERLAQALDQMPKELKRRMLLAYLGFPFYDVATLPLARNEGLTEYDPVKVDRISPDDAKSIRDGGTSATLRGTEFYNFGAFFSRAYRENDYLWGRLHGAERMIDLVCSTLEQPMPDRQCLAFKRDAFLAILDEEERAGRCRGTMLAKLREEVTQRMAGLASG
ncbi:patatin-like protein [Altererythrobacter sp. GH1-8]|uniref:patatin-like protein n=1 Tax=Altererythrobacter sp. GH1-8 TaxID=3349333 RepID=UPI00374D7E9D